MKFNLPANAPAQILLQKCYFLNNSQIRGCTYNYIQDVLKIMDQTVKEGKVPIKKQFWNSNVGLKIKGGETRNAEKIKKKNNPKDIAETLLKLNGY